MPAMESAEITALRETVCALHAELVRNGLVAWTSGNVSARLACSSRLNCTASSVIWRITVCFFFSEATALCWRWRMLEALRVIPV